MAQRIINPGSACVCGGGASLINLPPLLHIRAVYSTLLSLPQLAQHREQIDPSNHHHLVIINTGLVGIPPCPPTIIISCDENILYYGHAYGGNWSIFPPIGSPSYRISLNFRRFFGDAFFSPDVRAKSATIGATRQRNGLLLNKTREQ